jgi:hypothetical protein
MRKICIAIVLALTLPATTHAASGAEINIGGPTNVTLGQTFAVPITLSTEMSVNAGAITIQYSKEMLTATEVKYNKSIFTLWEQIPSINQAQGAISLTGGLPTPGFSGKNGTIVVVRFTAKAMGSGTINITNNSELLLNNGEGTPAAWSGKTHTITITKSAKTEPKPENTPSADTTPPESLELYVGHDSSLFNGDWYAIFQGHDAESGIDHYEIAELPPGRTYPEKADWIKAISPYRLIKQKEDTTIFVKAVDKAGNQKVTSTKHTVAKPLPVELLDWKMLIFLLIVLLCAVVLPIFIYHRRATEDAVEK